MRDFMQERMAQMDVVGAVHVLPLVGVGEARVSPIGFAGEAYTRVDVDGETRHFRGVMDPDAAVDAYYAGEARPATDHASLEALVEFFDRPVEDAALVGV